MGPGQIVDELKAYLQHGEQLLTSHVPGLAEWAAKAEADPLVQAALSLVVPPATKVMLASLLKSVEADVAQVEATARAEAEAAAEAAQKAATDLAVPGPDGAPAEAVS
jgi:hypothetical protein